MVQINPYIQLVGLAALVLVQFTLLIRWIYRHIRDDEIAHAFIRDLATNHLPHLQLCLELIADRLDLVLPPRPPIRWVDPGDKK